jgi:acyl-coenzyme A thioesterase PaaI-like protein
MALLAESASGYIVGLSLPAGKTPVIKSMTVNYLRRAKGGLEAVATLSDEARKHIQDHDAGEVLVDVTVTDERGDSPIECEMLWAWRPDRR